MRGPWTASANGPAGGHAPGPSVFADYFDGERALRQRARLYVRPGPDGRELIIEPPDGQPVRWPVHAIRRLPDQAPGGPVGFALDDGGPDRLVVEDAGLVERLDPSTARPLAGPRLWPRAVPVVLGGVLGLALLFVVLLPGLAGLLAAAMDPDAEVAMGELHYEQTRSLFAAGFGPLRECRDPAGLAALGKMTNRVAQGVALPYDLRVAVLDDSARPILNAYAVAGGRITFFASMIEAAEHPDEIAAVLAHELGHVVNHDPVRHMLQTTSGLAVITVLIGDVTGGGLLGGTAAQAVASGYSRRAELAADAFAAEQLRAVGLPPSALGRMFERLRARYGDTEGLLEHFASHPALLDRIETADAAGDPVDGVPALPPAEWAALRGICGDPEG